MKLLKKLSCLLIAGAILLPYTAIAEDNTVYHEAVAADPMGSDEGDISLQAAPNALSGSEIALLEYIAEQIKDMPSEIEIPDDYRISGKRFEEVYGNHIGFLIQHEHPEIFYFDLRYGYRMLDDKVIRLVPSYTMTEEARDAAKAKIDAEVNNIVDQAKDMTETQKALFVHDYIASHYEYDTELENRTLDVMVNEKKGVCQGYSYLYMVALGKLGMECTTVPSDALGHMWNKVKVDGKWYNVDVTFDDPISDKSINILHDYFLVNDDEIKALDPSNIVPKQYYSVDQSGNYILDHNGDPVIIVRPEETSHHITWNSYRWDGRNALEISDSEDFSNSVLHSIAGRTAHKDGEFYCINNQNDICKIIFNENVLREDYTLSRSFRWYPAGNDGSKASGYYITEDEKGNKIPYYSSAVAEYNGEVYVNSADKVYRYVPGGSSQGSLAEVYEYDGDNKDISNTYFYGLTYDNSKGGILSAEYAPDPNSATSLVEVKLATVMFPVFDEPLPCDVTSNVETVTQEVENEAGELETVEVQQVTLTVDIPDTVTEAAEEVNQPVTVNVAKYADGAFIGFEEVTLDENKTATFTAGDECSSVKTFVWAGFIMPLAMAEELNLVKE